jgi:hypothetical protein
MRMERGRFLAATTLQGSKGGRPKHTLLEAMRTKAWLTDLMRRTGATNYTELDYRLFGPPPEGMSLTMHKLIEQFPSIRWSRHAKLTTGPDETQLGLVNQRELGRGSKSVFQNGPEEDGEVVHLWCVFELDFDAMWLPIESVCVDLPQWRRRGAPFSIVTQWLAHSLVPPEEWEKLNFKDPGTHPRKNAVVTAYSNGYFEPSLKYLAATMALWRHALHRGESMAQTEYLVRGLLAEPCKKVLMAHEIYSEFVLAFNQLEIFDLIQRGELDLAKKLLAKLTRPNNLA